MSRRRVGGETWTKRRDGEGIDAERCFFFYRPLRPRPITRPLSLFPSSFSPQPPKKTVIVKASSGPRYVVGCRPRLLAAGGGKGLTPGTRVTLDMTTLTIMRSLKREVDPVVHNMAAEDPGKVDYSSIGGLGEQVRLFFFENRFVLD